MTLFRGAVLTIALACAALGATAQGAAGRSSDDPWRDSFAAFAAADRQRMPDPGGVVFVGSSSIRLWNDLETQFADELPIVVKRGFGGGRLADCTAHLSHLVTPYKPRQVVVYAGENDLAEGRTPDQVLRSFVGFVEGVHAALPKTRITYVSIKPSPLRASLMPAVVESNRLIADYVAGKPNLDYVDVYSSMLDAHGKVRTELFREDALHLNAAGYALWHAAIAPRLR